MSVSRIAVVEDDVDTSRTIGAMLREAGYETVSYFHPSSDIPQHLKSFSPDLIILDARLNSTVSGWDIVRALKDDGSTSGIPIILCSAAVKEIAAHRELLEQYGVPVLPKPFDVEELATLVDRMLTA